MFGRKNIACILLAAAVLLPATAFSQTDAPAQPALVPAPPVTAAPAAPATGAPAEGVKAPGGDANAPVGGKAPESPLNQYFIPIMLGALVLKFLLTSRSKKKQEQKKKDQLASMKKGDRVTTIGGIIGTIIEVKPDEIVVKVDEQNNVRMRFLPSAIAQVGEVKEKEEKK